MKNSMPNYLKMKIKEDIHSRLNPPWSKVFLKLAMVQFLTSFIVLGFCPQFDLGFFSHNQFSHLLMNFGPVFCNFACGFIFIGLGSVFAIALFSADDLRKLRSKRLPSFSLLGLLCLIAFIFFGVKVQVLFFASWLVGALLSSFVTLEIHWQVTHASSQ